VERLKHREVQSSPWLEGVFLELTSTVDGPSESCRGNVSTGRQEVLHDSCSYPPC